MQKTAGKSLLDNHWIKFVLLPLLVYTAAWLGTEFTARQLWKGSLPPASRSSLGIDFLLPFLLIALVGMLAARYRQPFRAVQLVFIAAAGFVLFNTFILHLRLQNYGDYGQLSNYLAEGRVFSRWLAGSSLLNFLYHSVVLRILGGFDAAAFVKLGGGLLMSAVSIWMINRHPQRLAVLLPLFTPIWLLLSLGYNEYYPFIAPVFLAVLVLLSGDILRRFHPLLLGLLAAAVALLYAGFVPVCLFLLLVYTVRAGIKKGLAAAFCCAVSVPLLILVFWPSSLPGFISEYRDALNATDANLYPGQYLVGTPFFQPRFAFSRANLRRIVFMSFWAGGLASIAVLAGSIIAAVKRIHRLVKVPGFLAVVAFFVWQAFYFIFMIPRLGPVDDIDLFFTVYITFAFFSGMLVDLLAAEKTPDERKFIQLVVFAMFTGSTAPALLRLAFLGLPAVGQHLG